MATREAYRRTRTPYTAPRAPKSVLSVLAPMALTGTQLRYLRSLGHHLDPLVQLGKQGLTDAARDAVEKAIARHELVKVRLGTECPDGRDDVAERLGSALKAEVAQRLGRTILLYRRHAKKPTIVLPPAG